MRTRRAIVSSMTLFLFGCGNADERAAHTAYESQAPPAPQEPDVAATPSETDAPAVPDVGEDLEITRRIREKLVGGPDVLSDRAQNVAVFANHGVVTLSGSVEDEREKEIVLSLVRETEGVSGVEDRLEIAQR